jgi:hypothetical protein
MSHENLSREQQIEISSERSFGVVFSIFFLVVSVWPVVFNGAGPRPWALVAAVLMGLTTWLAPYKLKSANIAWHKLGLLLGRIVSPIALAIIFFLVITPIGFIARLCGKVFLKIQKEPKALTYWQERTPPGPAPDSLNRQF